MAYKVCLAFLLVIFAACSEEEPRCGEGNDQVPDIIEEGDLDTFWIANLGVSEYNRRELEAAGLGFLTNPAPGPKGGRPSRVFKLLTTVYQ